MIKRAWVSICGALVAVNFLLVPQLAAQDDNAEPPPGQEEQKQDAPPGLAGESRAPADSETGQERPQTIDDLDSFVPSEEVSSDLSISYPVDI